ncbi:MAG TPA: sigma-70 family RNA polymerase sigma factor [Chthoniobacteraceae bacterium]|nr:sigma-70 family RNA polymerase sigma factor [Chthoniobacteraceae bacterium]
MSSSEPDHEQARESVNALFVQFSPEIRGFILALMPNMSRADDVFQETFLTVSRKAADFQPGTNFLAWACTIARFKVLEAGRKRPNDLQPMSEEVLESLSAVVPEPVNQEHELQLLNECMEELHPHTRRAMELRYEQGHKPAEIARRLSWTAESVYVVLSRARAALRDCVTRKLSLEGGANA